MNVGTNTCRPTSNRDPGNNATLLLARYEIDGERRFSSEVYEAELALTFNTAGAFLLGLDLGRLCTAEEAEIVERFLREVGDQEHPSYAMLARGRRYRRPIAPCLQQIRSHSPEL